MNLLIYIIVYPIVWGISRLPFWLLYRVSDFFYFILYTLLKYRVKVVRKNLHTAFPFKTEAELRTIEHKFYHHFCDTLLEMVKSYGMSEKEMKKRMVYPNLEVLKKYEEEERLEAEPEADITADITDTTATSNTGGEAPLLTPIDKEEILKKSRERFKNMLSLAETSVQVLVNESGDKIYKAQI